jgi:hypothetical protein
MSLEEIHRQLLTIYRLPHNEIALREHGETPESAAKKKVDEIRTGSLGPLRSESFTGPKVFLRVVGANRVYTGEWWFDPDVLQHLERSFSRIYFVSSDRARAIRDLLREFLALSTEWNQISEVWALELPAGEQLRGFSSIVAPQRLFANVPLSAKGNRMLVGGARQIFFVVKNPFWIKRHTQLAA